MQLNDKEYRIYIQVEQEEKKDTEAPTDVPTPKEAEKTAKKTKDSTALLIGKQVAQQAVSLAVGNYGNLTGDYSSQRILQASIGVVGDISSIIIAGVSMGPTGAIVAGVGVGLKYAVQGASYGFDILKQQEQIAIQKERLGNAIVGGNRR